MKDFWEQRYGQKEYAYGTAPNVFFKNCLASLTPGKILMAAEGEGRNAVYAARMGWEVYAYDWSTAAAQKAEQLATAEQVKLHYQIGSLEDLTFSPAFFFFLWLIYVHFPERIRTANHHQLLHFLKPKGKVIMEAFSKEHLAYSAQNPAVGGPKDIGQLYTSTEIETDFSNCTVLQSLEAEVTLDEGLYHRGQAKVVRFFGEKS